MRIIIYGVGAIGGTLAVMLSKAGHEVIGIARGKQLEAIRAGGLTLKTAAGDHHANFSCVADPSEIAFAADDLILLTMKTQDTQPALERLRAAGAHEQAVFCIQNGIANDDMALRLFPNVFGVVVEMPVTYATPGTVTDFFGPKLGLFDIARHGNGDNGAGQVLVGALNAAQFAAYLHDDLATRRYGKLLLNLGNAVDAVMGDQTARKTYVDAARAEANTVLAAMGVTPASMQDPARQALASVQKVPGADRIGSSSAQSLARGAGSIETDYLNGEIVFLGRKLGITTPVNAYFARRAHQMVRNGEAAGSVPLTEIAAALPGIAL